jgi:hypothetical protein
MFQVNSSEREVQVYTLNNFPSLKKQLASGRISGERNISVHTRKVRSALRLNGAPRPLDFTRVTFDTKIEGVGSL